MPQVFKSIVNIINLKSLVVHVTRYFEIFPWLDISVVMEEENKEYRWETGYEKVSLTNLIISG